MTATVPKSARRRLVKAELRVMVGVTFQAWADDIKMAIRPGAGRHRAVFDEWGRDDPFVRLCRLYEISPDDLIKILEALAEEAEYHALRHGYEDAWSE